LEALPSLLSKVPGCICDYFSDAESDVVRDTRVCRRRALQLHETRTVQHPTQTNEQTNTVRECEPRRGVCLAGRSPSAEQGDDDDYDDGRRPNRERRAPNSEAPSSPSSETADFPCCFFSAAMMGGWAAVACHCPPDPIPLCRCDGSAASLLTTYLIRASTILKGVRLIFSH
jgi:hypothetical protein